MPKKIHKPFCTIYKRSEAEKRAWNAVKELDAQRSEIEELKKQLAELKGNNSTNTEEDKSTNKRKSSKKTN